MPGGASLQADDSRRVETACRNTEDSAAHELVSPTRCRVWHLSRVHMLLTALPGVAASLRPPATVCQPSGLVKDVASKQCLLASASIELLLRRASLTRTHLKAVGQTPHLLYPSGALETQDRFGKSR